MGRQADGFCKARYGIAAPPILILMKTPSPCPHQPTVHRIAPSSDRCQTVAARGGALNGFRRRVAFITCLQAVLIIPFVLARPAAGSPTRPRIIVTSDGEIDDECSLVRFLLYTNEWDVEGIITSSSQYHWQGHKWAGDDWAQPYLKAYAEVYPNLIRHDPRYPTPAFLQSRTLLGNVKAEGEMEEVTPGSQRIVEVLLDKSDPRPVWLQAWGGTNTIARALKTIEEQHPDAATTKAALGASRALPTSLRADAHEPSTACAPAFMPFWSRARMAVAQSLAARCMPMPI